MTKQNMCSIIQHHSPACRLIPHRCIRFDLFFQFVPRLILPFPLSLPPSSYFFLAQISHSTYLLEIPSLKSQIPTPESPLPSLIHTASSIRLLLAQNRRPGWSQLHPSSKPRTWSSATARSWRWTTSASRCAAGRCSASSAPTAPERQLRSR